MTTFTQITRTCTRVGVLALCMGLAVASLGIASARAITYPNSMDALGDSSTRAYNTCKTPFTDCPENSWATGTNKEVNSAYLRLLALNPEVSGHNYNDAVSGAKMSALNGQAEKAVARKVELVGILMGANDACTSNVTTMTSVASYQSQFEAAMKTLTAGIPSAQINVLSLINVYQLWELFHTEKAAVETWEKLKICQSMLVNPTKLEKADEERRLEVKRREEEYDSVLRKVCAEHKQCRYDNGVGLKTVFTTNDVSTRDYFHPSIEGQALIAKTAWETFAL
jgi:lysophospholipase L1-like esterase